MRLLRIAACALAIAPICARADEFDSAFKQKLHEAFSLRHSNTDEIVEKWGHSGQPREPWHYIFGPKPAYANPTPYTTGEEIVDVQFLFPHRARTEAPLIGNPEPRTESTGPKTAAAVVVGDISRNYISHLSHANGGNSGFRPIEKLYTSGKRTELPCTFESILREVRGDQTGTWYVLRDDIVAVVTPASRGAVSPQSNPWKVRCLFIGRIDGSDDILEINTDFYEFDVESKKRYNSRSGSDQEYVILHAPEQAHPEWSVVTSVRLGKMQQVTSPSEYTYLKLEEGLKAVNDVAALPVPVGRTRTGVVTVPDGKDVATLISGK